MDATFVGVVAFVLRSEKGQLDALSFVVIVRGVVGIVPAHFVGGVFTIVGNSQVQSRLRA